MWITELATKTTTAESRIGSHNSVTVIIATSSESLEWFTLLQPSAGDRDTKTVLQRKRFLSGYLEDGVTLSSLDAAGRFWRKPHSGARSAGAVSLQARGRGLESLLVHQCELWPRGRR